MGRSVDYLNHAEFVLYFPAPDASDEEGNYDNDLCQIYWDDMVSELINTIKKRLPSYYESDKWDGRETRVILENQFCLIGLSEYCGLCSLSVACKEVEGYYGHEEQYKENFAKRHAQQIEKTLAKIIDEIGLTRLSKMGTFSNGESVYQKAV